MTRNNRLGEQGQTVGATTTRDRSLPVVDTVPCGLDVRCTYHYDLEAWCPIINEPDRYDVTVAWTPDGETFEKHALEDTLDSLTGRELAHEELTARLYDTLASAAVEDLRVELRDTAHVDMTVVKKC